MKRIKKFIRGLFDNNSGTSLDFSLFALTIGLLIFGVIMVFSASYYWSMAKYNATYSYLIKDTIFVITGIGIMYFASLIDYRKYQPWGKAIFIVSVIMLMMVIWTPLGKSAKGATRWLDLGIITVMPGELAKLAAILCVSAFITTNRYKISNIKKTVVPILIVCGIYFYLIIEQPNMSTAVTVVLIIVALMFVAGLDIKYFLAIGIVGFVGGLGFIIAGGGYRLSRLTSFLDPFANSTGEGYQVAQSMLALGSGGIFGNGLGDSVQKMLYLPEPQNDFILAIIGEELGFIGIMLMIVVFVLIIWKGIMIAMSAPDKFGFLLCAGVMMMIGIQLVFNIAIVTSSMPPTGVALPFVSYGGNATWMFCYAMGIVLNVSRQAKKADRGVR